MTTGKTIALTRRTFVGKVMSLLFNMLSRLLITFLPRSKRLIISWLQSPSAVISTGDRDQDHPHGKEMQKSQMAVWGSLTNSCEEKRSEKPRRKGKI